MADKNMEAQISVEFEEATSRQSLNSGETINTLWSKVKRWLSDLKAVAFSGSYIDLSDKPTTATTDTDGLMSAEDKSKLDSADNTYALKSKYGDTTINVGRKAGTAGGIRSTAEGYNTTASGDYSHAEGASTTASGNRSHAEGYLCTASSGNSHAEGNNTTASGTHSHSEGDNTIASGIGSHAGGASSIASSDYSFAHGMHVESNNSCEVSLGKFNKSSSDTLFSIGDGTSDDARHNAIEITKTGGKLHDKDIAVKDDIVDINTMVYNVDFSGVSWIESSLGKFYIPIALNNVNKILSVSLGDFSTFSLNEIVQPIIFSDQQIGIISNTAKSNGRLEIHITYI